MAILGYNTKGASGRGTNAGRKTSSKFTLASAMVLSELHGWFVQAGTTRIILVVYADSAGAPGARVAYTSPFTLGASGDIELSQTGMSVSLAAGDYWLGWVCETTVGGSGYCETTGGTSYEVAGATFNPPSDPFGGGGTTGVRKLSVWGVVSPAAVPPVAAFSGTPLSGAAPLEVDFVDESTNTPTSWAWDFGDGDTDTVQDPTHEYTAAGIYDVELVATNADGSDTETKAAYVTVSGEGGGPPTARFQLAFDDDTLEAAPAWTDMDDLLPVAEYSIDRGRSYELDRVDTGRATVTLHDIEGLLDPTNAGSPYLGQIQPLKQARLALWNPVLEDWYTRFRGFVESYEYEYDPSQLVNRVTITLVDIFEIISAIQMFPGYFGDPIPPENVEELGGNVFFEDTADGDEHGMQRRVTDILNGDVPPMLGTCGIPDAFHVVFSGNVSLHEGIYSAGESAMSAIQEAVDAEFPGVGNAYCDRLGRFCVHGRFARFDPVGTAAATVGWDFNDWKAGDGAAVAASPSDTAHIRAFSVSRDLDKIINYALASPKTNLEGSDYDTAIAGNVELDDTSKGYYGLRTWETQNLLTKEGVTDGFVGELGAANLSAWKETKRFAEYYVDQYAEPQNRITSITFRSMNLNTTGAAANWLLLSEIDINDRVAITIDSPGGGGFDGSVPSGKFYVEGIHEIHRPAGPDMDDVTMTLDLSPFAYFEDSPFAT